MEEEERQARKAREKAADGSRRPTAEAELERAEPEAEQVHRRSSCEAMKTASCRHVGGVVQRQRGKGTGHGDRRRELGLEGEQARLFAAAFEKEGADAAARVLNLFTGEFEGSQEDLENAMDGFYWFFGSAGYMTDSLATELGKVVSTEEVAAAREEMRLRNKKQVQKQVDMQVAMMDLPDLSDGQRAEINEVFGGGMMKEQSKVWGEIMKSPRKLLHADSDEKWAKVIEPSMAESRVRMRAILNDKQYEAYQKYEKQMVKQSRIWIEPYLKSARAEK